MDKSWRRATLALGVLLLAALLWGGWQWWRRGEAEALQLAQQQRALYELVAQVEHAQVLLGKSTVAGSAPQRMAYLSDAWRHAFGAQSNLNQLPLGPDALMRTSQLLAQAGDYAHMLAQRAAADQPLTPEERATLAELQTQLGLVAERLHHVIARAVEGGRWSWRDLRRLAADRLSDGPNGIRDGFDELGRQLVEFPTLIYDGPFSDHIEQRTPQGLQGRGVDESAAADVAAQFLGLADGAAAVDVVGQADGVISAWQVRITRQAGIIDMDVSQQGGHVVWMLDSRDVGPATIDEEEALVRARQFLADRGHVDVVPTWVTKTDDRVVIPFVYVERDVVIYPDMMKVTVALDNGEIIGYDGLGLLMAHRPRDFAAPVVEEDEARRVVHESLSVQPGRLALIPRASLEEVLTWEFPASADGVHYVVYVNAWTGEEERILQLLDTDEGWLVM